jgi:hypothetical protein
VVFVDAHRSYVFKLYAAGVRQEFQVGQIASNQRINHVSAIIWLVSKVAVLNRLVVAEMRDLWLPYIANKTGPDFATYLENFLSSVYQPGRHNHSLAVVQSSGTGKTRGCLELISKHFYGVYILCSDVTDGWRSNAASFMVGYEKAKATEKVNFCVSFLRQLEREIQERVASGDSIAAVSSSQFTEGVVNDKIVKKCVNLVMDKSRKLSEGTDDRLVAYQEATIRAENSLDDLCVAEKTSALQFSNKSIVVVFDEAHGLFQLHGGATTAYRHIQRALEDFDNMVGIFTSTSSKLTEIYSNKKPIVSLRPGMFLSRARLPPIFQVYNSDIDRTGHPFLLGRPLWRSMVNSNICPDPASLIGFAAAKLLGSESSAMQPLHLIRASNDQINQHLALLCCRFGMEPVKNFASDFVCRYMAWMTAFDEKTETCTATYASEPVLAEASACVTAFNKNFTFDSLMATLRSSMTKNIVPPPTDEIAAAIAMTYCADTIRKQKLMDGSETVKFREVYAKNFNDTFQKSMSMDIPVLEFLDALTAEKFEFSPPEGSAKQFEGWSINFTHFVRLSYVLTADAVKIGARRCAAFYALKGGDDVDVVVPVFKRELDGSIGQVTALKVQVKNYLECIGMSETRNLLNLLGPSKCEPLNMDNDLPSILLLFMIGAGSATLVDRRSKDQLLSTNELQYAGNQMMIVLNFAQNGGLMYNLIGKICYGSGSLPQDMMIRLGNEIYCEIYSESKLFDTEGHYY